MKKFLLAHYEKIILAALLIIFAALLYYQLLFVQKAQNQDVAAKVNPVQKPSDYQPIDFSADKKYRTDVIFSEWNRIEPEKLTPTKTGMMYPYPMAECVFCHSLIPAGLYPAVGETKNGECPVCKKALAPRVEVEDELSGAADLNGNGIPDEWESQYSIAQDARADSDEDSDGFTLMQEYKAKTDPTDPLSHPKYISQIYVSAIRQQRFTGLELVSVDTTKADKKDWVATFNVVRNNKKRSEFVRIGISTFKNNNVDFSLIDIEVDEKTQDPVAIVQRVGKQERIPCYIKQTVFDPVPRVTFLNTLPAKTEKTNTFIQSVGSEFKLGTAKTGEELYRVVSADPKTKKVIVESVGETPETIEIQPAPKDNASINAAGTPAVSNPDEESPFNQRM